MVSYQNWSTLSKKKSAFTEILNVMNNRNSLKKEKKTSTFRFEEIPTLFTCLASLTPQTRKWFFTVNGVFSIYTKQNGLKETDA